MKTARAAVLILLTATLPLHAQFITPQGEYGYQFIPNDPNSGYGGQLWFFDPQTTYPLFGAFSNSFDPFSSFILTPEQPFNVDVTAYTPPVPNIILPQTPFPYTGAVTIRNYLASFNYSTASAAWDQSGITAMNISGGGRIEFLNSPNDAVTSFVDTNIYGVIEGYSWTATETNLSWTVNFTSWDLQQVISDPSYSGSENGSWLPIIPTPAVSNPILLNGGAYGLYVSGPPGSNVVLQASSDLQTWTPLQTNSFASGLLYFSDPQSPTNASRFYRAVMF